MPKYCVMLTDKSGRIRWVSRDENERYRAVNRQFRTKMEESAARYATIKIREAGAYHGYTCAMVDA